ncbi:hypothetical protein GCM10011514_30450 [Emticicia aquatilis]|uniref:Uncharacterized protein n=1 Tax=Emticicia aquatilis TaxID=1537369 RepID=A0A917DT77_9BACT|nr:hypothetical protein GCM10011514_30450 [Emticicia aquatilis]
MGCDPVLDATWKSFDCKTLLEFSVDKNIYQIFRHKNEIVLIDVNNNQRYSFPKVSGEFSKLLSTIINFNFKLPNRKTEALETPPPAYYFLPFYIDQRRSWSLPWNSFENLDQYANWKQDLIKYDVGLISDRYFEIQEELFLERRKNENYRSQITSIDTTFNVLRDYLPQKNFSIDPNVVEQITKEIEVELVTLAQNQEEIYNTLAQLETEKTQISHQLNIASKIVLEYEKDYVFAVENIPEDYLECPLCGQIHENSIINRASILTDKVNAENQLNEIKQAISIIDEKISTQKRKLNAVRDSINLINSKYIKYKNETISYSDAINGIAESSLRFRVNEKKKELLLQEKGSKVLIKDLESEKRQLQSKEDKETINISFLEIFKRYLKLLNINSINMSEIESPLDFTKIYKEGGAAENTRTILAYYLTIYEMICNTGTQVIAPLVIDTPNQQEQSESNYDKIVETLLNNIPENNQIFLCAMENNHLKPFESQASIFNLDGDKLLKETMFKEVESIFKNYNLL